MTGVKTMTYPNGMFFLQSAGDLFQKLQVDQDRITMNPLDAYACFNFFVTAEHLPEWICAGNQLAANKMRNQEPLLRICSQLANGAKHFETRPTKHRAVVGTAVHNIVSLVAPGDMQRQEFVVHLSPEEASLVGADTLGVTTLSERIIALLKVMVESRSSDNP